MTSDFAWSDLYLSHSALSCTTLVFAVFQTLQLSCSFLSMHFFLPSWVLCIVSSLYGTLSLPTLFPWLTPTQPSSISLNLEDVCPELLDQVKVLCYMLSQKSLFFLRSFISYLNQSSYLIIVLFPHRLQVPVGFAHCCVSACLVH